MKLTVITCTADRPEAFALCQKYMARQTRQPDQWLVMDGPGPMPGKVLEALDEVTGDAVVWAEDDDFYSADWLEWIGEKLEKYELVGEAMALYYNVRHRWWSCCENRRHASLCQTGMRMELADQLRTIIKTFDNPFFDTRLWRLDATKFLSLPRGEGLRFPNEVRSPDKRRVIGIKAMPGREGYSQEHRVIEPKDTNMDPSLKKLWELIGDDAADYAKFYQR